MIYLDHHATTPMDPRVLEAMLPFFKEKYGNPSSNHQSGWDAQEAVEDAREQVAKLINCKPYQIIFTSGATESNNTIIKQYNIKSILTSKIEHSSILQSAHYMYKHHNVSVKFLSANSRGVIDIDGLSLPKVDLVSVMLVNNELGTIQDIESISRITPHRTPLHSDIAQALGKITVDVEKLGIDYASLSAHKIYGPKGIGALYLRRDDLITPLLHGGKQETGMRSGTLNVPAIVGFGKACQIIFEEIDDIRSKLADNAECFMEEILKIDGIKYHAFYPKVPGSIHLSLPCKDMERFLSLISTKVAISMSSACMSHGISTVLQSIGMDTEEIKRSVRVCLGRFTSFDEIRLAVQIIEESLRTINGG